MITKIEGELKEALKAAILAAGAWAERFDDVHKMGGYYNPYPPAGIKHLRRVGREDLIPTFKALVSDENVQDLYGVCCLRHAKEDVEKL